MSDLIRREDAIKALYKYSFVSKDVIEREINAIPSADRPRGEWIEVSAFDAFGGDESTWLAHGNPTAFHYCSECREQTRMDEFGEEILSNFCPNCGAKMDGGRREP